SECRADLVACADELLLREFCVVDVRERRRIELPHCRLPTSLCESCGPSPDSGVRSRGEGGSALRCLPTRGSVLSVWTGLRRPTSCRLYRKAARNITLCKWSSPSLGSWRSRSSSSPTRRSSRGGTCSRVRSAGCTPPTCSTC